MKKSDVDYGLYLCTDRELMSSPTVEECVRLATAGGATVVQLREKHCSSKEFYELGMRVKEITRAHGIPLIINDRADIALAVGADGVHVGQDDLDCRTVRRLVGDDALVGVSVQTVAEAVAAERDGADYLGVGAMFATATKTDAEIVTMEELAAIRAAVKIPIVVIGGINERTAGQFKGTGVDGIAVVSAIVSQPDVRAAAEKLSRLWRD